MSERMTETSDFTQLTDGYIVVAPLSEAARNRITQIQKVYVDRLGEQALWIPEGDQLHVTFAHILTPGVEYEESPGNIFEHLRPLAIQALNKEVTVPFEVPLTFDTVEASKAAIILKAHDNGTFARLRQDFVDTFTLPEGSRRPPAIIHSTLLRFRKELEFGKVQTVTTEVMELFTPFTEHVRQLQLIHERQIFVQQYTVLETFPQS